MMLNVSNMSKMKLGNGTSMTNTSATAAVGMTHSEDARSALNNPGFLFTLASLQSACLRMLYVEPLCVALPAAPCRQVQEFRRQRDRAQWVLRLPPQRSCRVPVQEGGFPSPECRGRERSP